MVRPETYVFDDDGHFPNSRLPALVYHGAIPADADAMTRAFAGRLVQRLGRRGLPLPSLPQHRPSWTSRPFVTSNIIGATKLEQLDACLASADIANTPEIEAAINAVH